MTTADATLTPLDTILGITINSNREACVLGGQLNRSLECLPNSGSTPHAGVNHCPVEVVIRTQPAGTGARPSHGKPQGPHSLMDGPVALQQQQWAAVPVPWTASRPDSLSQNPIVGPAKRL